MGIYYFEESGLEPSGSQIDKNFRSLEERVSFLENGQIAGVEGIASVRRDGNSLTFIGSQGTEFGPLTLPTGLSFRGPWRGNEFYKKGDVVLNNGSSYVVSQKHTSSISFFSDLEKEYFMPLAYQGAAGKDGKIGKDGSKWYIENGLPENNQNIVEFRAEIDIYVNADDGTIYTLKESGEWVATFNLRGATNALAVAFDTTETSLKSENLQGAVSELDARLAKVEEVDFTIIDGGFFD